MGDVVGYVDGALDNVGSSVSDDVGDVVGPIVGDVVGKAVGGSILSIHLSFLVFRKLLIDSSLKYRSEPVFDGYMIKSFDFSLCLAPVEV